MELTKQSIKYRGYKGNKYNTLLDDYEAGLTVEKLDVVFTELRDGIVEILNKIKNHDTFYEYDEDGEETDEIIYDADGNEWFPDAILIDGTSILN